MDSMAGKRGVRSSSIKQSRANRGGMRSMPPTKRVAGAFGKEGPDGKTPTTGRRASARRRAA